LIDLRNKACQWLEEELQFFKEIYEAIAATQLTLEALNRLLNPPPCSFTFIEETPYMNDRDSDVPRQIV
jgi:hypothetical protein